MIEKSDTIYVYADGATRNNQDQKSNLGAWGVVIRFNEKEKIFCGTEKNTTNNKMELLSCISGLSKIRDKSFPIIVVMDSQYVIDGVNQWSEYWKTNGWQKTNGTPLLNVAYWRWVLDLVSQFDNISFKKCKGHLDTVGNIKADRLCNLAMDLCERYEDQDVLVEEIKKIF